MKNNASIKRLTRLLFSFTILCVLLLFAAACSNSMDDVLSSYDERFPVKADEDTYKPGIGEVGFDSSQMLDDEYFKSTEGTLQLRGPRNAMKYEWALFLQTIVTEKDMDTGVDIIVGYEKTPVTLPDRCFLDNTSNETEYFIVYMPWTGLAPGSYVISLTATSKGGTKYLDSAALIIYDPIREL